MIYRPAYFVSLAFDSPVYVNTTPNNLVWGGETWLGAGILAEITPPTQNIEMAADAVNIRLTGVPVAKIAEAKAQTYRNRKAKIFVGVFNENWELTQDPEEVFSGFMDTMTVAASGESASISIGITSEFSAWTRANTYRFTNEMQSNRFENDRGLEFVQRQTKVVLQWGKK